MAGLLKTPESQMPSYPGLNDVATDLWRQFLRVYESAFGAFEYNVRVGQGLRAPAGATPEEAATWRKLTQKRIDVVASRAGETWIIEIDERPGARVLGQTLLYSHLGPKYYPMPGRIVLALICRYLGFDMFATFKQHGALIFKFPFGKPPIVPPTFLPPVVGTEFSTTYFKS